MIVHVFSDTFALLNFRFVFFQGTFAFTIYSWFPSAEDKFKIPEESLPFVLFANISLVVLSHLLMFRCLKEPGVFKCREHAKNE